MPIKRNNELDFWRIVFSLIVIILHSHGLSPNVANYPFYGGYVAVEFFLIITGYLTVKKAMSSDISQVDVFGFMKRKFIPIFKVTVPVVIIHYITVALIEGLSLYETLKSLFYSAFELLLLPANGTYVLFKVLPLWYLSAILIVLPLFYYLCIRKQNAFLSVIAPLSCFLIYGYFSATVTHVDTWRLWTGFTYTALPRAWAGLCLGAICCLIAKKIAVVEFRTWFCHILGLIELTCFAIAILFMYKKAFSSYDFLIILLLMIGSSILFSQKASFNKLFPKCKLLGEFSLYLYASHWTVRMLIPIWFSESTYRERMLPYLLISLAYALLLWLIIKMISYIKISEKINRLIVKK